MRKITAAILLSVIAFCGVFCLQACGANDTCDVVCTIFPQYDLIKRIVGDEMSVKMLLPNGTDAHNYELTLGDKQAIKNAKLFVCIGGESERWVQDVKKSTDLSKVSLYTWMAKTELIKLDGTHDHEEEHEEGEYDDFDEHVYLSVKNCIRFVADVQDELNKIVPEKKEIFEANAKKLLEDLINLDEKYEALAEKAEEKTFYFADRFPFAYLFADYGWQCVTPYKGCSADLEISIADKVNFSTAYKNSTAKGVFTIENANKDLANSVLRERSGKIFELNSCQTVSKNEMEKDTSYVDVMQKNLDVIKEALE